MEPMGRIRKTCECTEPSTIGPSILLALLREMQLLGRGLGFTHKPLSSSFLGLPYGILNINHKKELLKGLRVGAPDLKP